MTSRFLIYGLTCPRCGTVRYIGKSSSGLERPRQHRSPSALAKNKAYSGNWIRSVLATGATYGIVVLEEIVDAGHLAAAEIRWIAHGRAQGWPLTNGTDGGDGIPNPSPEIRAKKSALMRGRKSSDETRQKIRDGWARLRASGFTLSDEARAKMAAAKIGTKATAETRAKMSATRRQRPCSEEQLAALAKAQKAGTDANRGRVLTPEHRAKALAAIVGRPVSPETRAKMSESAKRWRAERKAATSTRYLTGKK